MKKPILECRGLYKRYGTYGRAALDNLNLTLESGQIIGLLGPNGSGKTTLIKLLNGLLVPNQGEIYIDGMEPGVETKRIVSYLPERSYLTSSRTVEQLLDYFEDFYGDFSRERAEQLLDALQIPRLARVKNLSKGTREKVQLILVMSRDARLYVLDEPIGGVDPAARDYILRTILAGYREDATILLSTHLIADVESILDRVLFLKYGRIVMNAGVDEIREEQGKSVDALFREVFRC